MENRRSNHFSGTEDGYCTCLALRGETYLKIFYCRKFSGLRLDIKTHSLSHLKMIDEK
jgi:hypothetical protein